MFERLRFVVGFLAAYRRVRKAGTVHDGAMQAALDEMLGRRHGGASLHPAGGAALPEVFAGIWRDP